MKVQVIFKWFDFWIGIFYDQKKNWIYLLPIPMVGIIFKLPDNWRISSEDKEVVGAPLESNIDKKKDFYCGDDFDGWDRCDKQCNICNDPIS